MPSFHVVKFLVVVSLHNLELLGQVQDHLHARQIDAQVLSQTPNCANAFNVAAGIHTHVTGRPTRPQQPDSLVVTQSLRVSAGNLRHYPYKKCRHSRVVGLIFTRPEAAWTRFRIFREVELISERHSESSPALGRPDRTLLATHAELIDQFPLLRVEVLGELDSDSHEQIAALRSIERRQPLAP